MARRRFSYPISLAVVVATLIAATGGWIAWWNYRSGVENVRSLAAALFDQISREAAGETTSFLMRAPPAGETLAKLGEAPGEGPSLEEKAVRFLAVLGANPSFTWVSQGQSDGTFVGVVRAGGALGVNISRIGEDGKTSRVEHDVIDGDWGEPKTTEDTKYDPRRRPFYTLAATAKRPVWTPPYVFEGQNVPGISYAHPAYRDGQLLGVFTIDFDLARLSELTRELQFSSNGRIVLVSEDGVVLAHPRAPVVRGTELVRLDTLDDPAVKALRGAGIGATQFELGGEVYLARTHAIAMPGGPSWQVLAYAPEADFTAGLRGRVITSLLISLVAVVLAVGVAWLLARRVSRPLIDLSKEMEEVGKLNLDDSTDHSSAFKEIDMMNTALVKMKGGLRSFARYVPRDLVRTLVDSGLDAELTGELRTLTIFFSDLEGFTSLSETKAPDELVKFLGKYFDDMSNIIAEERGTIDKYLGDGIMAFWGAPSKVEDHAQRACVASLRCQKRVAELSKQGVNLTTRIGLATGVVLVGNVGSYQRMNYTVMGDVANLASRIEGLNKQYGTSLMISEPTYDLAKSVVVARPIDVVAVKGKRQGVPVFELLALREDKDATAEKVAAHSTTALEAYLDRRFAEAADAWTQVLELRPNDQAATVMRDRARAFVATPPPPEWTGVWVATSK
ncbi:MAG: adenylate/guanylate cyclase domain-containing protein [Kofleriaceae bacterium]